MGLTVRQTVCESRRYLGQQLRKIRGNGELARIRSGPLCSRGFKQIEQIAQSVTGAPNRCLLVSVVVAKEIRSAPSVDPPIACRIGENYGFAGISVFSDELGLAKSAAAFHDAMPTTEVRNMRVLYRNGVALAHATFLPGSLLFAGSEPSRRRRLQHPCFRKDWSKWMCFRQRPARLKGSVIPWVSRNKGYL